MSHWMKILFLDALRNECYNVVFTNFQQILEVGYASCLLTPRSWLQIPLRTFVHSLEKLVVINPDKYLRVIYCSKIVLKGENGGSGLPPIQNETKKINSELYIVIMIMLLEKTFEKTWSRIQQQ